MFSNNLDEQIAPASITKIMTALVLLDYYEITDSITISLPDNYQYSGKVAYLKSGESITIENLLEFLLIYSANDAAHVVAIATTGSIDSFVIEMNNKAKLFGMNDTTFLNPDGLDEDGHMTTLRDLLTISLKFIENFRLIAITSKNSFSSDVSGKDRIYYSTNQIIDNGYVGIKTGWTSDAGLTFIGLNLNNDRQILTIVNKSIVDNSKLNHFKDTELLYANSFNSFGYYESFNIGTELYRIRNPLEASVTSSNESWVNFVDLRNQVKVSFLEYVERRLKFINNISDREVRVPNSNYEAIWKFKLLGIFSVFAN